MEHVGSLLRPSFLRGARSAFARGEIGPAQVKAAENRAVHEVVALQVELDMPVATDGEMRRESFQAELTATCSGFSGVSLDAWLWGLGTPTSWATRQSNGQRTWP
jgi:5-methyltetrahydropteroyltriglutamate--homocysteine methyltransferase